MAVFRHEELPVSGDSTNHPQGTLPSHLLNVHLLQQTAINKTLIAHKSRRSGRDELVQIASSASAVCFLDNMSEEIARSKLGPDSCLVSS
ncbi:hypothetical protein AVEN_42960-1 [Araneus ventricosus]|uniref:Uncharacterized protein n=1 Tax=Araneus ventricosus TaxID=182803 RepID=A0A4Y2AHN6_ARAVE|nr:hypothetical protein AVEN_42960-1 [Araneus ventricosus]